MHVFFNQKIFSDNIFACVKNIKIIMTDLKNKELETNKNFSLFSLTWPIFIELALHCVTLSLNLFLVGKISVDLVAALTVGNQVFEFSMIIFNFIGSIPCSFGLELKSEEPSSSRLLSYARLFPGS